MLKQRILKKDRYKAIIIGAGRIGAQFDSPQDKEILTHAHAYCRNSKTDLIGFFDINKKAAQRAAKKWSCRAFFNFNKMFKDVQPDIISICTPDQDHFKALVKAAKHKPKIVICEKPVTTSLEKTQEIIKLYQKIGVPILVNYRRRFDKTVQAVKKDIDSGKFGKIICASGIYTKGILHNGSHLIDLAIYFFGEIKKSEINYIISDYNNKEDKSIAGFLAFKNCPQFHLIAGNERKFSIFELDIICEKRRWRFLNEGYSVSIEKVIPDPLFAGYQCLGKSISKKTQLDNALFCLVDNAINYLEKKALLVCDVDEAFKTQKACSDLLKNTKIVK